MTGMLRGPVVVTIRDAAIVTVACGAAALIVNAARPDGIPLVQQAAYEIFVPCPETLGNPARMGPVQFQNLDFEKEKVLVIDARSEEEFDAWHHPGAVNIPFDYLMPVCTVSLREVASSGARKVVVYGDGADLKDHDHG